MSREENSRLEQMIARLATQRALLDHVAGLIAGRPGPILEIGLGKGRTYTHLKKLFADRKIWAFDFEVHAPAHSQPPAGFVFLGDFRETLKSCWSTIQEPPAFVHADIGTESRKADAELAKFVGAVAADQLSGGGYLLGDRDMGSNGLESVETPQAPLPDGIDPWPYFLYRKA